MRSPVTFLLPSQVANFAVPEAEGEVVSGKGDPADPQPDFPPPLPAPWLCSAQPSGHVAIAEL